MHDTQINRGVDWLNKNRPGWLDKIDTDKLRIESGYDCIMGQLDGAFCHSPFVNQWIEADRHGFYIYPSRIPDNITVKEAYESLNNEWRERIATLRQAV